MFGDLERCLAKYVGDLEKMCSAIRRKHVRRLGENMFGDLEKTCSAIRRNSFGENVGDLEKRGRRSYGDFILEFVME